MDHWVGILVIVLFVSVGFVLYLKPHWRFGRDPRERRKLHQTPLDEDPLQNVLKYRREK